MEEGKLCVSRALIETIHQIIKNYNKQENITQITTSILSDHLNIVSNKHTIKEYLYSLAVGDRKNYVKILEFLMNLIDEQEQENIKKFIQNEKNIFYFKEAKINEVMNRYHNMSMYDKYSHINFLEAKLMDDEDFRVEDEYVILTSKKEGSFYYYANTKDYSSPSSGLKYSYSNGLLEFKGKKSRFYDENQQKILIEALYQELNFPVLEKDLKDRGVNNPESTFKNIKIKLKNEKGINQFTNFDIKLFLRQISDNGNQYYIMHG